MAVVKVKSPDISQNTKTFLSEDYASGTTLYVESGTGFATGNYIVVGEPGLEKSELATLSGAPGATSMTLSAGLSFSHAKGTPIYFTRWDKYELDYATSSTGSWTTYGSMPALLRWDALYTEYRDSAATTTYQWRYRYYSTEATAYSDYSDTIVATGWVDGSVGYMVRNVRKVINDPESKTITDTELIRYLNACQDEVYAVYDRWYFLLKEGTTIDTVASTAKYSLPSDFGRMDAVLFNYVSGTATDLNYQLKYLSRVEFNYQARDNNASTDDKVTYYTLLPGDSTNTTGYIKIFPTPTTAGLNIVPWYYKTFTSLNSYGDVTEVPIPSMMEDYVISKAFYFRREEEKATFYNKQFREKLDLLKFMQRKQVGPPRYLWQYRGRKAMDRYYGNYDISSDVSLEESW